MKRVKLDNITYNALDKICDILHFDWFYHDYYSRKTIDVCDVEYIYDEIQVSPDARVKNLPICVINLFIKCNLIK